VLALVLVLEIALACAALPFRVAQETVSSRVVLATVSDARNRAIVDLGADDFIVKEADQVREVLDARVADYPIVLLVDTSGAASEEFEAVRRAAVRFVARIGERPLALGTLGDPPFMLTTFNDDRRVVTGQLEKLAADPAGNSMALQAVVNASRLIRDTGAPFSAIIVISAAATDGSRLPAGELVAPILESGAMVHVVGKRSAAKGPNVPPAQDAEPLRTLADQTRGQFVAIYSAASYQTALDRLADRLSAEMMIQYIVPRGASARAASDVKVGVRLPGARVRGLGVK